jgi:hypothetical protein
MNWPVAADYELTRTSTRTGPAVAGIRALGEQRGGIITAIRGYDPSATPEVLPAFANLGANAPSLAHAYVEFARSYGLLGLPSLAPDGWLENTDSWGDEKSRLWKVLNAADILRGRAGRTVEKVLTDRLKGSTRARRNALAEMICMELNDAIDRHRLTPHLEFSSASHFYDAYKPKTLIGAIWVLALRAVKEGSERRQCQNPTCSNWVDRQATRGRPASYCSVKCRVAHDKARVSEARRLLRERTPLKAVEAATGLSADRIREIRLTIRKLAPANRMV